VAGRPRRQPIVEVVAVGSLKKKFGGIADSIDDYLRRLQPYASIGVTEAPECSITPTKTTAQAREEEGLWLCRYAARASTVVALAVEGKVYDSEAFSRQLARWEPRLDPVNGGSPAVSQGPMMMIIGGSFGLSEPVLQRADALLSLSSMTLPHHLARLILVEQLYRACRLLHGHEYHH